MYKKLFYLFLCSFLTGNVFGQTEKSASTELAPETVVTGSSNNIEMADMLYESGKIYVVVACLSLVLIGLLIYLYLTDRKIEKLKKRVEEV
ncbi:MAG: CcmD family protein [Bacteroidota bacterium]|nr:CcmD family protein [Bacteroidota bacterium]